jgi:hypothetical protein
VESGVAKARQLHKLFARQIAALSKPGRYSDGGGLYVVVDAGGTSIEPNPISRCRPSRMNRKTQR